MSHYVDIETMIKDQESLVKALERMGFKGKLEIHETATNLYGYHGDLRDQKANVIIRRVHVGCASNDIGFEKTSSGTYRAHISEFDSSRYNAAWLDKVYTYYGVEKSKKSFSVRGMKCTEDVDEKGRIRLRAYV